MEEFTQLFGNLLAFVYHCFDRIVIHGYLSGLSRPEQVVYFVRQVLGLPVVNKEVLSQRTGDYRDWVEAYARNHHLPMEWAEKGVRKEDYVSPRLHRLIKNHAYGVYFIFKSMEQGRTFRISVPKYPTPDPNYRILAHQRSRFTHYYFYIRDEVLGPIVLRVASFFPFHATYWKNAFLKQYEKFARYLRNELCSNNLRDFGLKKGLDHLHAVRTRFQIITDRFAGFQAQCLNVHVDFPVLQRLALPLTVGSVRYPGIKIHDTRIIRLLEVLLHGGNTVGGWSAKQIHQAVLTTFQLSPKTYGLNQLRYDLRKLKGHD